MEEKLKGIISSISAVDSTAMEKAKERQRRLAKPPGSLGRLEQLSIQLAGITGKVNNRFEKKELIVFASDNGVCEEGVSCAPQSVTLRQAINLTRAKTGASVLARHFGCKLTVVDVGINAVVSEPAVIDRKIAFKTKNIAKGAAMTRQQALKAVIAGAETAMQSDADIIGLGEMGIGNTTTSSAVLAALLGVDAELVTGRGGGLSDEAFLKKKRVISEAIKNYSPEKGDVIEVLAHLGGFDIAALCGAYLGAAAVKKPVVIDGFITAVAAVCAVMLCPPVREYLIPSHASFEKGYQLAVHWLGLEPMLLLDMRLGEGSGCPLAFQIVDAACAVINEMADFDEAEIDDSYLEDIRRGDKFTP